MVSVGNRSNITNYTFPRLATWASKNNYTSVLFKSNLVSDGVPLHFNKLIVHKQFPSFERYLIVDDDLMLTRVAPPLPELPNGYVGLARDAVQTNTLANHVSWTGNTGFIIANKTALNMLEAAYNNGEYPYNCWDGSGKGIWGPYDQAALLNVLFQEDKIVEIDKRWNSQIIVNNYTDGLGWEKWKRSKIYRLQYYFSLFLPFSKSRKLLKAAYGIHMTMGLYPKIFKFLTR